MTLISSSSVQVNVCAKLLSHEQRGQSEDIKPPAIIKIHTYSHIVKPDLHVSSAQNEKNVILTSAEQRCKPGETETQYH